MQSKLVKRLCCTCLLFLTLIAAGCSKTQESDIIDINVATPNITNAIPVATAGATPGTAAEATPLPAEPTPDLAGPTPTHRYTEADLDGTDDATPVPKLSYEESKALNQDVIGWINVPNTQVDYPVVKGTDNDYYLTHGVDKSDSKSGAIFVDARCSLSGKHIILYGHNMKNGTMFASLYAYNTKSFYENNRTFTVKIGDTTHTYKVFSVYTTDVKKQTYTGVEFANDVSYVAYMQSLAKLSKYPVDVEITADSNVVTLSTCNRTDYSDGRYVIHAIEVK